MEYGRRTPNYLKVTKKLLTIINYANRLCKQKNNTALLNRYLNGDDYISPHKDNEKDWVKGASWSTLAFG